jgi:peptidyl-prolyl cis-trans isomerase B (cyclophilin B)
MRRRLIAVPATLLALSALAACGDKQEASDAATATETDAETSQATDDASGEAGACDYPATGDAAKEVEPPSADAPTSGTAKVTLETSVGTIKATLDQKQTPCTVHSFLSLAEQGYFDGTDCHRMTMPASGIAVLQCGDPTGTGMGGPGYAFADELNGSETYPAGTLAMANSGPDTNGSQFFIVYGNTPLPPHYTVFGTIDKAGLEVVQKVAAKGTADGAPDGAPKETVTIESAESA